MAGQYVSILSVGGSSCSSAFFPAPGSPSRQIISPFCTGPCKVRSAEPHFSCSAHMAEFNTVLLEFLEALHSVFPEVTALATYRRLAGPVLKTNPQLGASKFLETVGPYSTMIVQRDPAFFKQCPGIIQGVDMHAMWNSPSLTDENKNIIWQYLSSLWFLAAGSMLPPDTMTQIHSMAANLQKQMEAGQLDANLSSLFANDALKF